MRQAQLGADVHPAAAISPHTSNTLTTTSLSPSIASGKQQVQVNLWGTRASHEHCCIPHINVGNRMPLCRRQDDSVISTEDTSSGQHPEQLRISQAAASPTYLSRQLNDLASRTLSLESANRTYHHRKWRTYEFRSTSGVQSAEAGGPCALHSPPCYRHRRNFVCLLIVTVLHG